MNLATFVQRAARLYPGLPAVCLGTHVVADHAAFAARCARMAGALQQRHGLRRGDRVALLMKNCPEYLEALYAAWWAGLAAVPVNAKLHAREARFIVEDSGAKVLFVSADWSADIDAVTAGLPAPPHVIAAGSPDYAALLAAPECAVAATAPGDLAWLFYTSGTTGRPKGAMLSHANLIAMAQGYLSDVDTIAPGDCIIHAAPLSHGSGLYSIAHVLAGAANVVPGSGGFDADEVFDLVAVWRNAMLFAAPTIVRRLVDRAEVRAPELANLKTIVYGGGPMYVADLERALAVMGPRFAQIYGQGESPMTITAMRKDIVNAAARDGRRDRLASVGVAHSAVDVRVCGASGEALAPGAIGEVCVRGATVMGGYWNSPEASAAALRDGWLWTGDLGSFDADGFLTLKDRSKDLIISGGSNIYPREVEEVLLSHPDIVEASVVGAAHAEWGEEVVAFVVSGARRPAPAELDALCLGHIARFKRPKRYVFVEALPKNHYGKVLKTELRERLKAGPG